jgi:hypothetical protein
LIAGVVAGCAGEDAVIGIGVGGTGVEGACWARAMIGGEIVATTTLIRKIIAEAIGAKGIRKFPAAWQQPGSLIPATTTVADAFPPTEFV